jgi:hypothetical protein
VTPTLKRGRDTHCVIGEYALDDDLPIRPPTDPADAGCTQSKALPEPEVAMRSVEVRPDKSDNEITMKINQWAADTYPVAHKHLDTARTLENLTKKRSSN